MPNSQTVNGWLTEFFWLFSSVCLESRPYALLLLKLIHSLNWHTHVFICRKGKIIIHFCTSSLLSDGYCMNERTKERAATSTHVFNQLYYTCPIPFAIINRFNIIDITEGKCNYQQLIKTNTNTIFVFVRYQM